MIEERLQALDTEDETGAEARSTVVLDQQSVGRLSRMDALQQQAMAAATHTRRKAERAGLMAALARLDTGAFGICKECGEDIAAKRLSFNPALTRCITCARG
ncbi:MAG: TraR/DksA C4-type zinc finger protein [Pseudomonadota bacterium]